MKRCDKALMKQLAFSKGQRADLLLGAFLSQKVNRSSSLLRIIRQRDVFRHGSSSWADGKESKNHHGKKAGNSVWTQIL